MKLNQTIAACAVLGFTTLAASVVFAVDLQYTVVVADRVDAIELNTVYDSITGRRNFEQAIFWRWNSDDSMRCIAWRMTYRNPIQPTWNARLNCYEVTWKDGSIIRRVRAESFIETHTNFDRELVARGGGIQNIDRLTKANK